MWFLFGCGIMVWLSILGFLAVNDGYAKAGFVLMAIMFSILGVAQYLAYGV